jgi:hypothetical protein
MISRRDMLIFTVTDLTAGMAFLRGERSRRAGSPPGMTVKCWGYNGHNPGPIIEAVDGDRVGILIANRLPEHTTVHWYGIFIPNKMYF